MTIENILRTHLEKKARVRFRQLDIEELNKMLEYKDKEYKESHNEAIEGLCMNASVISDMPKSITNKFHSKTETAAMNYREEYIHSNDFDVIEIKGNIEQIKKDIEQDIIEVERVEAMLTSLNYQERFIVEQYYIHGLKWPYVENFYYEKFKEHRHINRLMEIRDSALQKINKLIS